MLLNFNDAYIEYEHKLERCRIISYVISRDHIVVNVKLIDYPHNPEFSTLEKNLIR